MRDLREQAGELACPGPDAGTDCGRVSGSIMEAPRTTPDAALQPRGPAWSHTPRFCWQTCVSPCAIRQGRLCRGHGLGSSAQMEAREGWCARGPSPGLASTGPASGHRASQGSRSRGRRRERERSHKPITLSSCPCRASWPKPGGELWFIDKHLFLTPFLIKLSPTCPNCLEAIRVSTAGSFMGTAGANSPPGLWAENELLLTTPNLEPRGPPGVMSQTQLLLRSKGWVRAEG